MLEEAKDALNAKSEDMDDALDVKSEELRYLEEVIKLHQEMIDDLKS